MNGTDHRYQSIQCSLNLNTFVVYSYPELKPIQSINAHPSNCICIKFDPTGKYFATGSADALVSLWDVEELVCVRCFSRSVCVFLCVCVEMTALDNLLFYLKCVTSVCFLGFINKISWITELLISFYCSCHYRLDWPVRTLSFSHDGKMLASASEDHFIDIAEVETGPY